MRTVGAKPGNLLLAVRPRPDVARRRDRCADDFDAYRPFAGLLIVGVEGTTRQIVRPRTMNIACEHGEIPYLRLLDHVEDAIATGAIAVPRILVDRWLSHRLLCREHHLLSEHLPGHAGACRLG